ncbi:hypothetical protein KM043_003549 [Ampulex compressa]|nr:hypothetical protein KM043_003549 [Ampulex compressa]
MLRPLVVISLLKDPGLEPFDAGSRRTKGWRGLEVRGNDPGVTSMADARARGNVPLTDVDKHCTREQEAAIEQDRPRGAMEKGERYSWLRAAYCSSQTPLRHQPMESDPSSSSWKFVRRPRCLNCERLEPAEFYLGPRFGGTRVIARVKAVKVIEDVGSRSILVDVVEGDQTESHPGIGSWKECARTRQAEGVPIFDVDEEKPGVQLIINAEAFEVRHTHWNSINRQLYKTEEVQQEKKRIRRSAEDEHKKENTEQKTPIKTTAEEEYQKENHSTRAPES